MEFFEAGANYRERCFMAANRIGKCISAETMIQHPDGSETSAGDLYAVGKPFKVMSWDGSRAVEALAVEPIKKPSEPCFRVWLSNGQWFDCASEHRLLTISGWSFFSDLRAFYPALPPSNSGFGLITRLADVQHWLKTHEDSLADCLVDCRSRDERPLFAVDSAAIPTPSLIGAPQRGSVSSETDGLVSRCTNIHQSGRAHHSILDALRLTVGRFVAWLVSFVDTCAGQTCDCIGNEQQLPLASISSLQSGRAAGLCQSSALLPPYKASNNIIAYQPIGSHEVYDFTVPEFGNYIASGAIHHNTEGAGGFETTLHLTGKYPHWWKGRRFDRPVKWWAAGKTNETTRDIVQEKLFGKISFATGRKGFTGTGLVPGEDIGAITWKQGVQNLVDTIAVQHISGEWSTLGLKSYQQGRGAFEGTEQDGIWLDEEPPMEIYGECLIRTATTNGIVYTTFTPLEGMSEMAMSFLPNGLPDA